MCVYCMIGDHPFRHDPPWKVPADHPAFPYIPQPVVPMPAKDWPVERLREYLDLLRQVKALEDQIGCPCEPNKADYIKLFEERIAHLERELGRKDESR